MDNEVIMALVPGKKRPLWNVRKNGHLCNLRFPTCRLANAYLANRLTKVELHRHVLSAAKSPVEYQLQAALAKAQWTVVNTVGKWVLIDGKLVLGETIREAAKAEIATLKAQLEAEFEARTGRAS
jgi:hypothetical protein